MMYRTFEIMCSTTMAVGYMLLLFLISSSDAKSAHHTHARDHTGNACIDKGGYCQRNNEGICDGQTDSTVTGCSRKSSCCLPIAQVQNHGIPEVLTPEITSSHYGSNECGVVPVTMVQPAAPMTRIVGGVTSQDGQWPWQVGLKDNFGHVCGGTLVHPQWIVTAAHCLERYSTSDLGVFVGDHFLLSTTATEIRVGATEWILHPNYSSSAAGMPNDIALIKLNTTLDTTGNHVRTACMPAVGSPVFGPEDTCFISGWGYTMGTAEDNILQHLEVKITSRDECNATWRGVINSNHVCIGNGDKGACRGDSGGPLVCLRGGNYVLAGVTSWGSLSCSDYGYPNIYTMVQPYLDWISHYVH